MRVDATEFVKQKEHNLASKYARRTLRQMINRNATSTKEQLNQIEKAYKQFIETPVEGEQA